jgi:hypothetical protein
VAQHTPFAISRSLCERFNQFAINCVCGRYFTHVFTRSLVSEFPIHSRMLYFYCPRFFFVFFLLSSCSLPILFSLLLPTFSLLSSCHTPLTFTRAMTSPARYFFLLSLCSLLALFRFSSRYFFLLSLCSLPAILHSLSRVRRRHQLATSSYFLSALFLLYSTHFHACDVVASSLQTEIDLLTTCHTNRTCFFSRVFLLADEKSYALTGPYWRYKDCAVIKSTDAGATWTITKGTRGWQLGCGGNEGDRAVGCVHSTPFCLIPS